MKKLFLFFILGIFLINILSASSFNSEDLGVGKQNENFTIIKTCYNASYITLSTIKYPEDGTIDFINLNMTSSGGGAFAYNFTDTSTNGIYYITGITDGCENSFTSYFEITTIGNKINNSQMTLYSIIVFILIFLFLLCVWGGLKLPFENVRNENREVITINWKKYLKIFCWGMSYFLLLSIIFVIWNLIYAYSQWEEVAKVFYYMFRLLYIMALPVLIGVWLMAIINYINDKKINSFIKRTGLAYDG